MSDPQFCIDGIPDTTTLPNINFALVCDNPLVSGGPIHGVGEAAVSVINEGSGPGTGGALNLENLTSDTDQILIRARGDITLKNVTAGQKITIFTHKGNITINGNVKSMTEHVEIITLDGKIEVNGNIEAAEDKFVHIKAPFAATTSGGEEPTIKVTGTITQPGGLVLLKAGKDIVTGSIDVSSNDKPGTVDIFANQAVFPGAFSNGFIIGPSATINGVKGTLTASTVTGGGSAVGETKGGVKVQNKGTGGIAVEENAITVSASQSKNGVVILDAVDGNVTVFGNLSVSGQSNFGAGTLILLGSGVDFPMNSELTASDNSTGLNHGIIIATQSINYTGTLSIEANGSGGPGASNTFLYLLGSKALIVNDTAAPFSFDPNTDLESFGFSLNFPNGLFGHSSFLTFQGTSDLNIESNGDGNQLVISSQSTVFNTAKADITANGDESRIFLQYDGPVHSTLPGLDFNNTQRIVFSVDSENSAIFIKADKMSSTSESSEIRFEAINLAGDGGLITTDFTALDRDSLRKVVFNSSGFDAGGDILLTYQSPSEIVVRALRAQGGNVGDPGGTILVSNTEPDAVAGLTVVQALVTGQNQGTPDVDLSGTTTLLSNNGGAGLQMGLGQNSSVEFATNLSVNAEFILIQTFKQSQISALGLNLFATDFITIESTESIQQSYFEVKSGDFVSAEGDVEISVVDFRNNGTVRGKNVSFKSANLVNAIPTMIDNAGLIETVQEGVGNRGDTNIEVSKLVNSGTIKGRNINITQSQLAGNDLLIENTGTVETVSGDGSNARGKLLISSTEAITLRDFNGTYSGRDVEILNNGQAGKDTSIEDGITILADTGRTVSFNNFDSIKKFVIRPGSTLHVISAQNPQDNVNVTMNFTSFENNGMFFVPRDIAMKSFTTEGGGLLSSLTINGTGTIHARKLTISDLSAALINQSNIVAPDGSVARLQVVTSGDMGNLGSGNLFVNLSSDNDLLLDGISTIDGSVAITLANGKVITNNGTSIICFGGGIKLKSNTDITCRTNSILQAFGGEIRLLIGPMTEDTAAGIDDTNRPDNVLVFPNPPVTNPLVFWGTEGIKTLLPNNSITADTFPVKFETNGTGISSITLRGNVVISTAP